LRGCGLPRETLRRLHAGHLVLLGELLLRSLQAFYSLCSGSAIV